MLESRAWGIRAARALEDGRAGKALAYYSMSVWKAPELLASPLAGPGVAMTMAKSLAGLCVGPLGLRIARSLKRSLERRLGRDPGADTKARFRDVRAEFSAPR